MTKKITIELEVSEQEEAAPGVYRTYLKKPGLEGGLYFVHNKDSAGMVLESIMVKKEPANVDALFSSLGKQMDEIFGGKFK